MVEWPDRGVVRRGQGSQGSVASGVRRLVSIVYHDELKEVQDDAALAALLAGPAAAPFDRLEWWRALAEECDLLPLIAVMRDGRERGVMALHRQQRSIHALGNWYSFRVRPLFTAGAEPARMLAALGESLAGRAPHLVLAPLPDENGEASALAAALRRSGWMVFMSQSDVNHVLPVAGRSFAEYMAERPGPLRTTLKRKGGKVSVSIESHFDPASWAAYEAVYAQSWKPNEGSPAFLRRFAQAEGAAGRLRLGLARTADGQPVAAQLWTVESGTAFIHKLAHTEASKPVSPGTTLTAALFEQVIDRDRVSLVDFGTGDDPYKRDWMETVRPRYRIEAFRAFHPGNWPAITRNALRVLLRRG